MQLNLSHLGQTIRKTVIEANNTINNTTRGDTPEIHLGKHESELKIALSHSLEILPGDKSFVASFERRKKNNWFIVFSHLGKTYHGGGVFVRNFILRLVGSWGKTVRSEDETSMKPYHNNILAAEADSWSLFSPEGDLLQDQNCHLPPPQNKTKTNRP